jgi:DNA-binding response OmpR family regulator
VPKILLVEDDLTLAAQMTKELEFEKHLVTHAASVKDAERLILDNPSLVLLDWQLPDGTGYDLLRKWRAANISIPVIMLTARTDVLDKVVGLEGGANDYLTKPVEIRELFARIRVQLRGSDKTTEKNDVLRISDIEINSVTREAKWKGNLVELTKMEFDLLRFLMESPNRVFTRDELLNKVWGFDRYPSTRTVDTHIGKLRSTFAEDLFESVRGVGYRLKV